MLWVVMREILVRHIWRCPTIIHKRLRTAPLTRLPSPLYIEQRYYLVVLASTQQRYCGRHIATWEVRPLCDLMI